MKYRKNPISGSLGVFVKEEISGEWAVVGIQ